MHPASSTPNPMPAPRSEIGQKMAFDTLRYAMVWEDVDLLYTALDIGPADDVLSITSAGDNVLGLLLQAPRSVTALDLNPCQSALLQLKLAALRVLDHDDFLALLGVRDGADRPRLYAAVRPALPEAARAYWDAQPAMIAAGPLMQGRLERYFEGWRPAVLHRALPPDAVAACFEMDDPAVQQAFFERHLAGPDFQAGFEWYFGEEMMGRHGRDRAQFAYADLEAGPHFYARFRHAFTRLPLRENPYLAAFMTGRLLASVPLPPYLQAAHYERLRALAERVTVVTAEVEAFVDACAAGRFSKGNFSDMFEYMAVPAFAALLGRMRRVFRPGGRLAYWSLLADRSLPAALATAPAGAGYRSHDALAHRLWQRDRAWFYRSFHVLEAA